MENKRKKDTREKRQTRRTTGLFLLGAALSYALELLGIVTLRQADDTGKPLFLLLALLLLCALLSPLLARRRARAIARRRHEEGDGFLLPTRERSAETAEEKLRLLRRLRIASWVYAACLLLAALAGSFLLGGLHSVEREITLWWPFGIFAGIAMARIPLVAWERFSEEAGRLEAEEFPQLHRLCQRAAETVGCRERMTLRAVGGSEVTVAGRGKECLVSLGMDALPILTEDELYQLLLRAFSAGAEERERRENRYAYWLQNGRSAYFLGTLGALPFRLPDVEYEMQFQILRYAAAFGTWQMTDRSPVGKTDAGTAASALLRLRYRELWSWEQDIYDWPPRDSYDELLKNLREEQPAAFRRELPARRDFWDSLIEKETVPEHWSGVTLREQLRSLGVEQPELLPYEVSETYREELLRAAEKVDGEEHRKQYEADQAAARETLEAWEAAGRPLRPQDFGEVISALRTRGRLREALAFCERAIGELPSTASIDYPCFFKGCTLLHAWDARGLQFLYRAMEGNGNYIDSGLETVGNYCRLSGDREALRQFEERAPELLRRHEEEDSEIGVLRPTDKLSAESLPEALREDLLRELPAIGGGAIRRVYLVHKTVSPTRYTSAMVVELEPETPPKRADRIMQRIFNLLDDSTEWQFSLFRIDEVREVKVESIEGSLFYERASETET